MGPTRSSVGAGGGTGLSSEAIDVPVYEWDPTWPQPLPDTWVVGPVVGVSVDAMDHIWVVHRPRGAVSGWQDQCCVPAPAVIEFGQEGNVVQAWGGPRGEDLARPTVLTWSPPTDYEWVQSEHNIFVDHRDNVWLGNYGGSHILKMSRDGELLLQIGRPKAQGQDSNDTGAFGSPDRHHRGSGDQRGVRGRRVRQPPCHRLRCRHGCLQAALGSLRQHA